MKIDLEQQVGRYQPVSYIVNNRGFIAWRRGTGDNVELLHIKTSEKGRGYGRSLIYQMLDSLQEDPPYYSVFGFTRSSNQSAQAFYGALGFNLQQVDGLYTEGSAVLFWQSYTKLRAEQFKHENRLHSESCERP